MLDYDWLGYGLLLKFPHGTVFLQGDDASSLYDELEACESQEDVEMLAGGYSDFAE